MPTPIALSLHAMATRFELVLYGDDPMHLRAAGEEALREIESLDAQLSLYRPESDLTWINAHAYRQPVRVEPQLFDLLRLAGEISAETDGAFDITMTPLLRAWGFVGGTGSLPDPKALEEARAAVGMRHTHLDSEASTIRFDHPHTELDLGAIGKGYAIERAADSLRENGITSALLHGGTSSVCGIGHPPDLSAWRIGVRDPHNPDAFFETVDLLDSALGVSAIHGKSFTVGSRRYGHVIDPRTGQPTGATPLAAVT